jgi:hypothetical protein
MRFLNAIPAFRKGIIESTDRYPLVLGLGRIFGSINSSNEIKEERLVVPLERRILPLLNQGIGKPFRLDGKDDVSDFIYNCFNKLHLSLVQCFQFTWGLIYEKKSNPGIITQAYNSFHFRLDLPIERDTEEKENDEEFVNALNALGVKENVRNNDEIETHEIRYYQIVHPPEVLFICIRNVDKNETENKGPVTIPLEFKLPEDLILYSKSFFPEYKVLGGFVPPEPTMMGIAPSTLKIKKGSWNLMAIRMGT